jgi:hypothetical protein
MNAEWTDSGWHLDRKVPIGIIVALIAQLGTMVWYASKMESRIFALESLQAAQHERDERQDNASSASDALIRAQLVRIDDKLDRLLDTLNRGRK